MPSRRSTRDRLTPLSGKRACTAAATAVRLDLTTLMSAFCGVTVAGGGHRKPDATCYEASQRSVASMGHDEVSGPVQFSMFTFRGPLMPADIRRVVDDLRDERYQGLRLIDALVLRKDSNGTLTQQPSPDPLPEIRSAGLISKLLARAGAETALATGTSISDTYESRTGRGYIFQGERLPDPRDTVPPGCHALALLIEHQWAAMLHDAILRSDASPVGDAWIGVDGLQEVGLMTPETANKLAGA